MKKLFKGKMLWLALCGMLIILSAYSLRLFNGYRFHVEKQTRFMMDTFVTIYVVAPQQIASDAVRAAFERMQEVDRKFSTGNPEGAVYAFNHSGSPISDPEIVKVVAQALEVARKTDGAFDVTIEPLIELWGFYGETPVLPEDEAIKRCLSVTGYKSLHIRNGTLFKDREEIRIDLGGIAKGYAIQQARDILKAHGVASGLIDAGGDVYALGRRGGKLWKIGIRNPRGDGLLGLVEVEDAAVMGSGDYQRFFELDGHRYHHIFDPKTGYPVEGLISTTLIYSDPTLADAWNTAIFVMGRSSGLSLVEQTPGMEAMMVTSSGEVLYSSGLENALSIDPQVTQLFKGGKYDE